MSVPDSELVRLVVGDSVLLCELAVFLDEHRRDFVAVLDVPGRHVDAEDVLQDFVGEVGVVDEAAFFDLRDAVEVHRLFVNVDGLLASDAFWQSEARPLVADEYRIASRESFRRGRVGVDSHGVHKSVHVLYRRSCGDDGEVRPGVVKFVGFDKYFSRVELARDVLIVVHYLHPERGFLDVGLAAVDPPYVVRYKVDLYGADGLAEAVGDYSAASRLEKLNVADTDVRGEADGGEHRVRFTGHASINNSCLDSGLLDGEHEAITESDLSRHPHAKRSFAERGVDIRRKLADDVPSLHNGAVDYDVGLEISEYLRRLFYIREVDFLEGDLRIHAHDDGVRYGGVHAPLREIFLKVANEYFRTLRVADKEIQNLLTNIAHSNYHNLTHKNFTPVY